MPILNLYIRCQMLMENQKVLILDTEHIINPPIISLYKKIVLSWLLCNAAHKNRHTTHLSLIVLAKPKKIMSLLNK